MQGFTAFFGRFFFIPAYVALALGLFLPGDYAALRPLIPFGLGGILFFTCLRVRLGSIFAEAVGPRAWARLALLSALKLAILPLPVWLLALVVLPEWAPGILLVACMPAGMSSAAFADLQRGNTALALLVIIATSLLCCATVPPLVAWGRQVGGIEAGSIDPSLLLRQAGYMLLLLFSPFALAQLARLSAPRFVARHAQWWSPLGVASLCFMIFVSVSSSRGAWNEGALTPMLSALAGVTGTSLCLLLCCVVFGRVMRRADAVAFGCNLVYMNNGLGIAVASAFYPDEAAMVLPSILMQVPMVAGVALVGRAVGGADPVPAPSEAVAERSAG